MPICTLAYAAGIDRAQQIELKHTPFDRLKSALLNALY